MQDILVQLGQIAKSRGDGELFVTSLTDFHQRLRLYPQFGDPLMDLLASAGQIRLGVVFPLVMRYAVHEDRRTIFVGAVPVLFPRPAR